MTLTTNGYLLIEPGNFSESLQKAADKLEKASNISNHLTTAK
ncbi:putative uncharacterized protein [Parachlamydia acanthamoebae UV-7]|uniref:Uncharacterized protein n=2 Tax=Parachlamydia acanthamoebae TaxID=83552 RepID=F8KZP5_PARAV|nr:hypothetical protein [Parachlamydia acanthamoebae]EFB42413.1 hypothetical protein pah_c008o021 [Parachlamydia acanthamoebae str. Hall's coccus]KIA77852.1 hypothetical protein DB43_FM00040 [Parachlamydia acanthamoebae]CCB86395.1 putative uncharacterized protein [Parachlamydia acanthamoebae UV-7]